MKVNIQMMIYAKCNFLVHLQGLKNPVLKLLSLQTQNFALKQTHFLHRPNIWDYN